MSVVAKGRELWTSPALGTNKVACAQCHPNGANTHPETYPKFQQQLGRVIALREMINWCIQQPLEGKPLALDDPKMVALEAWPSSRTATTDEARPVAGASAGTDNGRIVFPDPRLVRRRVGLACCALAAAHALSPGPVGPGEGATPVSVHLGVIAEEPNEPDRMLNVFGELIARLRERLSPAGVRMGDLVIARDLEDMSQRLVRGDVDFVIETVFPTLVLQERSRSLEPALVVVRRGQREYRSVFFTRKDAPIQSLRDLRGKTLVLQALRSTSAFALPKAELERAGLSLAPADDLRARPDDVRYVLALAEINQAVWVLHGKGAAGAFNEGDWAALPERVRSQLRVFHETAPIVRGLLSFRAGLDPRTRSNVETALLKLEEDEAGRAALARAAGVTHFERLTAEDRRALRVWAPILRPNRPR
jgi:phosphonate transport system substrate-binding protein